MDRRRTEDWDFGVQVADWAAFAALRAALLDSARFTDCPVVHRLVHQSGVPIDFVPFGDLEAPPGSVTFAADERTMQVAGFAEALEQAVPLAVAPDLTLPVVNLPGFVLLKLFSANDRRENQQTKDLQDIRAVFAACHAQDDNRDRTFDELADFWEAEAIDWDTAGAALMGHDVAAMIRPETYARLVPILDWFCDAESRSLEPLMRLRVVGDERDELSRRAGLYALFAAFRLVLAARYAQRETQAPGPVVQK
ncbi:hypothetical protein [Desulfovibrio sp. DV]|uniref:hypothetical protein n=1 Tax=Desulfovibrio sp. DV TaxID=1844708 RepID=UPI00111525C6|nr:hypothetical protein [Desulfovibrio sp. DV]